MRTAFFLSILATAACGGAPRGPAIDLAGPWTMHHEPGPDQAWAGHPLTDGIVRLDHRPGEAFSVRWAASEAELETAYFDGEGLRVGDDLVVGTGPTIEGVGYLAWEYDTGNTLTFTFETDGTPPTEMVAHTAEKNSDAKRTFAGTYRFLNLAGAAIGTLSIEAVGERYDLRWRFSQDKLVVRGVGIERDGRLAVAFAVTGSLAVHVYAIHGSTLTGVWTNDDLDQVYEERWSR